MVIYHKKRGRKKTGGRYRSWSGKKKRHFGNPPTHTKVGSKKVKVENTRGGNEKRKAQKVEEVNLLDPEDNECKKVKVEKIVENEANRHFARMGVITKGAIIQTGEGKARVTNRPGQEGFVNAVLIEESE